jgi:hypothetical protein
MSIAGLSLLIPNSPALAQTSRIISYQGTVAASGVPLSGVTEITVTLYGDPQGTQNIWTDSYTTQITGGVFNLQLGSNKDLPEGKLLDRQLWLGISVNGAPELRPLTQLGAAFVALNVADQSITKEKLAPEVITMMKGHDRQDPQAATGFDEITTAANTGATMTVGGTASLVPNGSGGIVRANEFDADGVSGTIAVDLNTAEVDGILPEANGGTGTTAGSWNLDGNSGTTPGTDFVGTYDSTALEIKVFSNDGTANRGSKRVMKYIPTAESPNIIGGYQGNTISNPGYIDPLVGSTITGGGTAGAENAIRSKYSVINGGHGNLIDKNSKSSVIDGGTTNTIFDNSPNSYIGGGGANTIDSGVYRGIIVGGESNYIGKRANLGIAMGISDTINEGVENAVVIGNSLTAQSYNQTIIGRYNSPRGGSLRMSPTGNDPLFQIGNGTHDTLQSNAFEVTNNGHSIVYHTNGKLPPAVKGGTFTDNIVYAWGYYDFSLNDNINKFDDSACFFGVDTIINNGTGDYEVRLNLTTPDGTPTRLDWHCAAVMAIPYGNRTSCPNIRITNLRNVSGQTRFNINVSQQVLQQFGVGNYILECQPINTTVMFMVVGRCPL